MCQPFLRATSDASAFVLAKDVVRAALDAATRDHRPPGCFARRNDAPGLRQRVAVRAGAYDQVAANKRVDDAVVGRHLAGGGEGGER